jgi:hypothetical protein
MDPGEESSRFFCLSRAWLADMARPLRLAFAGALCHVTSRGDGREAILLGDNERRLFLDVLAGVGNRFNWSVHAYCLMTNHYLRETPQAKRRPVAEPLNEYAHDHPKRNDAIVAAYRCGGAGYGTLETSSACTIPV